MGSEIDPAHADDQRNAAGRGNEIRSKMKALASARRQKCRRTEAKCGEQSMAARKARVEKLGRVWRMVWPQQVGDGRRGVADGSPPAIEATV